MRLKDNLYTISDVQCAEGTTHFRVTLNAAHTIYRAHFPAEPVTPGVCLVQMAVELAEVSLGQPLQLKKAVNVKFLSVVSPLATPCIRFAVTTAPTASEALRATVLVDCEEGVLAKMSLLLIPAASA